MDQIRRSARPRTAKKKSDLLYFDDQKIELNEQERDLIYPNEKSREKRYCFCKRTEEEAVGLTMIECDSCHDWFHDECLGLRPEELQKIEVYNCPTCSSKPIKYMKKTQPSNAEIELLLTALAELDEEKPRNKKKDPKVIMPKVSLFHFAEPVNLNKHLNVIGFIKNESSSACEDNKMIVPITKEDLDRGSVWTSWGNYRIATTVDGKLQASSEYSFRSPTRTGDEKTESPVQVAEVIVKENDGGIVLCFNEEYNVELPVKNMRFEFDMENGKRILEAARCVSFDSLRETFNANSKFKPAAIIKVHTFN